MAAVGAAPALASAAVCCSVVAVAAVADASGPAGCESCCSEDGGWEDDVATGASSTGSMLVNRRDDGEVGGWVEKVVAKRFGGVLCVVCSALCLCVFDVLWCVRCCFVFAKSTEMLASRTKKLGKVTFFAKIEMSYQRNTLIYLIINSYFQKNRRKKRPISSAPCLVFVDISTTSFTRNTSDVLAKVFRPCGAPRRCSCCGCISI